MSSQWRKLRVGMYESPDGKYQARRQIDGRWRVVTIGANAMPRRRGVFDSFADCRQHAAKLG